MVSSDARTPEEYLARLPDDRRDAIAQVVDVVRDNLPAGYEEGMQYGMIAWYVPLSSLPATYNGQPLGLAAVANQKHYMSLYLNSVYGDADTEAWFRQAFAATGRRLDMGKSCVRFRRIADLPLEVIGQTIARADLDPFVARYLAARGSTQRRRA
jgi:hypothetical protein